MNKKFDSLSSKIDNIEQLIQQMTHSQNTQLQERDRQLMLMFEEHKQKPIQNYQTQSQ